MDTFASQASVRLKTLVMGWQTEQLELWKPDCSQTNSVQLQAQRTPMELSNWVPKKAEAANFQASNSRKGTTQPG